MNTGGMVAWLPWRVSCKITEVPGVGLGIWLGSILEGPAMGAPVWPTAGDIVVVIDWFGSGGGIPNILGGCAEPGTVGGGPTCRITNVHWLVFRRWINVCGYNTQINTNAHNYACEFLLLPDTHLFVLHANNTQTLTLW